MAYRLMGYDALISDGIMPTEDGLQAHDLINDPIFDNLIDELLHERSVCEFVRELLDGEQQADLARVDAFWRDHAVEFNATFGAWHNHEARENAMSGWVQDEYRGTPKIPRSHWWWWPIDPEQGSGA